MSALLGFGPSCQPITGRSYAWGPQSDLRRIITSTDLLCYWDVRPWVPGAQASITMSPTLQSNGSSPPTVTMTGPLSPRQVVITYSLGGDLGTMKYIIVLDNTFLAGTSPSNGVVDIGLGNKIIFSAGAYNTGQSHWLECVSWGGLLGVSDDTLDNALSGVGARYEAFGMNGKWPCLRFIKNPSALCNTSGVPQKVTGVDVDFEVYTVGETFQHITGVGASIIWGFSQSAALHTSKSYISKRACGEANPGHESRFLINRRDSSATPSTVECTSDGNTFADLDPRIMVDCITSNGQMYHGGVPCRALGNVNMHLGVATNVDRYGLGNFKLSSSAFSTANQWLGRVTAQAITKPQSPSKRIEICKALLGIPLS